MAVKFFYRSLLVDANFDLLWNLAKWFTVFKCIWFFRKVCLPTVIYRVFEKLFAKITQLIPSFFFSFPFISSFYCIVNFWQSFNETFENCEENIDAEKRSHCHMLSEGSKPEKCAVCRNRSERNIGQKINLNCQEVLKNQIF